MFNFPFLDHNHQQVFAVVNAFPPWMTQENDPSSIVMTQLLLSTLIRRILFSMAFPSAKISARTPIPWRLLHRSRNNSRDYVNLYLCRRFLWHSLVLEDIIIITDRFSCSVLLSPALIAILCSNQQRPRQCASPVVACFRVCLVFCTSVCGRDNKQNKIGRRDSTTTATHPHGVIHPQQCLLVT